MARARKSTTEHDLALIDGQLARLSSTLRHPAGANAEALWGLIHGLLERRYRIAPIDPPCYSVKPDTREL